VAEDKWRGGGAGGAGGGRARDKEEVIRRRSLRVEEEAVGGSMRLKTRGSCARPYMRRVTC
jgi:hypothetical protein